MEISNFELVILGVFIGGCAVKLADFVEKRLELKLRRDSMELDMTLGKALMQIKESLNKDKS